MRRIIETLFLLVWGLWFGGIIFLFLAVTAVFDQSHELGLTAAPVIFFRFEKYHLVLALISISLCSVLPVRRAKFRLWIFALIAVGCVTALISSLLITPRIDALHLAGLTHTPAFLRLHGAAFGIYLLETLVLLIVGLIWSLERP